MKSQSQPKLHRKPRQDSDFSRPLERSRDSLGESRRYQAQLAWTIFVAVGMAVAAFSQLLVRPTFQARAQTSVELIPPDEIQATMEWVEEGLSRVNEPRFQERKVSAENRKELSAPSQRRLASGRGKFYKNR